MTCMSWIFTKKVTQLTHNTSFKPFVFVYSHTHISKVSCVFFYNFSSSTMADHLMPSLINLLSSLLQRVAESNDLNRPLNTQKLSVFNGLIRPNISVQSYLERIFRYANCSPSCYVVAYVYLDRFMKKQPYLPINSFNVHRLLVTSVLTSIKFMDDMWVLFFFYPILVR